MRVDSPGLDVGDGPLDHLADLVDAPVGLLRGLAQLAVGGLLMGRDHSPSHVSLVDDPPGGIDSLEQSGRRQGGHVVHGPQIRVRGPHQAPARQDQDLNVHAGRLVLTATTIRGDCANSSRGRERRPDESRSPGAPPRP